LQNLLLTIALSPPGTAVPGWLQRLRLLARCGGRVPGKVFGLDTKANLYSSLTFLFGSQIALDSCLLGIVLDS